MSNEEKVWHRWSILCSNANVDAQTNNLSLFNIIEQVNISTELFANRRAGAIPMNLELVTLWEKQIEGQEAQADIEIVFQSPEGKELGRFPYSISMPQKRHRHFVKLDGLPFVEKSGRYVFKIRKKEKERDKFVEVGEVPIEITIVYRLAKQRQSKKG